MKFFSRLKEKNQKQNKNISWKEKANNEQASINISDQDIYKQMKMIDLTIEDLQLLKSIQGMISENITEIVEAFYEKVVSVEHLKGIIEQHSTVTRLRDTLQSHLIEMFSGKIDDEFLHKRLIVAKVHYRIGLEPKWYMSAFQNLMTKLLDIVNEKVLDPNERTEINKVVTKILNFEQQLVLEAYEAENIKQREIEYEKVKEELKSRILETSEEMAALSEQTSASVQQLVSSSNEVNFNVHQKIQEQISESATYTDQVNQAISEVYELVDSGQQESGNTKEAFEEIVSSIEHSITEVLKVQSDMNELVLVIEEIGSATSKVASSAQYLNDAAKNV